MTDAELRKLAMDIMEGRVFGSWQIPSEEWAQMLGSVFMPLALGGQDVISDDTVHVFEYLDKAGSRFVNGYPMFLSCQCLMADDAERLRAMVEKLQADREAFLSGDSDEP